MRTIDRMGRMSVALLASAATAASVQAAPSPFRQALQQRSAAEAFGARRLPALARQAGSDAAAVGQGLVRALQFQGLRVAIGVPEQQEGPRGLWLEAPGWTMKVSRDGSAVQFRTTPPGPIATRPAAGKPADAEIEAAGRSFVRTALARSITLAKNEELVFLGTRFNYRGGQAADAAAPEAAALAGWAAVFGRTIDGELVVGGGSIVAVLFDAEGTVEGFDFDWPRYQAVGAPLDTLDVAAIRRRAAALASPPRADESRSERRFECGYFDPGGRSARRALALVQPACVSAVVASHGFGPGNQTQAGILTAVPAARVPVVDPKWPEAATLCAGRADACRVLPIAAK